jgi:hypothetical protein
VLGPKGLFLICRAGEIISALLDVDMLIVAEVMPEPGRREDF